MSTLEQFKKQGFVKVSGLTPEQSLEVKEACAEKLASDGHILSSDGTVQTMIPPYHEEAIQGLIRKAHDKLEKMGFNDVIFWSARLINKPPGERERTWHQDWGYWTEDVAYGDDAPEIGVMVYLQETKRENGSLRVIPGAHRDVCRIKQMYTEPQGDQPDEVALECSVTDMVVIDARLPHATHANHSIQDRTMLTFWFIPNYKNLSRVFQEYFWNTKETVIEGITPVFDGPSTGEKLPEFKHSNFRLSEDL